MIAAYILSLLSCALLVAWIRSDDKRFEAERELDLLRRKSLGTVAEKPRELVPLVPAITRKKHEKHWSN